MDKNKSIDGLAPRRSKSQAASNSTAKKTTTKKTTKPNSKSNNKTKASIAKIPKPSKTTIKVKTSSTNKSIQKPKTNPTSIAPPEPEPKTPAEITEDFLKPTKVFNFDEKSGELEASEPSYNPSDAPKISKKSKKKKAKKPVSKKRKIITSIFLVIVLLLIGATTWLVLWGNDIIAKITGGQGNVLDLIRFVEPTYERLKTDENGRTNILAFGTSGYNMEGDEGNGTHDGAQLTDSIMVISFNQDSGDIAMLSLPRDLKASPTCTSTSKINEVYWCNGGGGNITTEEEAAAANALMQEVGGILGVDFQYFAHLNWNSLIQIVDILGGITVTLDEGIYDYNWTGAVFEPNVEYTIDGEKALGLARARHGTTGGDFSRGASQQKILIGIKNKIHEKDLSITDMMSLASTLGDNLRTNFSLDELKSIAHLASSFDLNSMRQVSLLEPERLMTTGNINGISYVLPVGGVGYYTRIKEYVSKMFSNDPRVYEEPSILVLNGTDTVGLASTEQASLEEAGYTKISTDNAPAGEYADKYTLFVLDNTTPGTQKMLEEKYELEAKSYDELPEGIPRTYNFVLIIGGTEAQE